MEEIGLPLAFFAGVISFLSPCVLPLVPSYLSFISGMSFEELTSLQNSKRVRLITMANATLFVLGFSAIFISLGASSSYIGSILSKYQEWMRIIGGVVVIIFGLFIAPAAGFGLGLMGDMKFMHKMHNHSPQKAKGDEIPNPDAFQKTKNKSLSQKVSYFIKRE